MVIDNSTLTSKIINLKHNACSRVIPISDTKLFLISFDRQIFQYELINDKWTNTKVLTDPVEDKSSQNEVQNSIAGSVASRAMMFGQGTMKKSSLLPNIVKVKSNIHKANICSVAVRENQLITCDLAGFIKTWDF